ncbi:hypothetical protein PS2_017845 [Malus domestica]
MVLSRGAQPNIPGAHQTHNLLISLNRQPGPSQVQEPKGHEPCGSPSTAPQCHNPRPQPHKLSLAQAKPSCPSSGPCHDISTAHAEPTSGPCQPTYCITPMAAPQ